VRLLQTYCCINDRVTKTTQTTMGNARRNIDAIKTSARESRQRSFKICHQLQKTSFSTTNLTYQEMSKLLLTAPYHVQRYGNISHTV
jgi:hypothetical protein